MSDLLARAGALFVAPATTVAPRVAAPAPPAGLVAVLARREDLLAVAGGVAAGLRLRHRARTVLVVVPAGMAHEGVALPAARALARRLVARELPATAAGAVVRVALPDDPDDPDGGVRAAWRAIAAAPGVPVVAGLTARGDGFDALLADADALLLAPPPDTDEAFMGLALASLAALGPPASEVAVPRGIAARRLAAAGFARIALDPVERLA